jgi:hypothetical protein
MELTITPEPSPEEREAIEQALRRAAIATSGCGSEASAWWKAGLEEEIATPDLEGEGPAAAPGHRSPEGAAGIDTGASC